MNLIAGYGGAKGNVDAVSGPPTAARFSYPTGVTVSAGGDIYVADFGNQTIRKISPAGFVTTLAGTAGTPGSNNGTGTGARFNNPAGVAVNAAGTVVYVADQANNRIRAIDVSTGTVTTIAGTGVNGSANNADGSLATFNTPVGLAVADDALYVAEFGGNRIRKITLTGLFPVTTVTGGVSGSAIRRIDGGTGDVTTIATGSNGVSIPDAIVANGNLVYVANTGGNNILKIDATNPLSPGRTVLSGSGTPGYTDNANPALVEFSNPNGIALAGSTLYVSDGFNFRIRAVNVTTGATTTIAGDGTSGTAVDNATGTSATFGFMGPLASDGSNLYMVDYGNHTVRKISLTAPYAVSTAVGVTGAAGVQLGALPGGLNGPTGISYATGAAPGVHLRVTDGVAHVVLGVVLAP